MTLIFTDFYAVISKSFTACGESNSSQVATLPKSTAQANVVMPSP